MTEAQVIALYDTAWWVDKGAFEICRFQLFECNELPCVPFSVLHEAMSVALARPVFTHEFGSAGWVNLQKEILGEKPRPSLDEILELIPEAKRILVESPEEE